MILSSTLCYALTVFPQLICLFVFMSRLSLRSTQFLVQSVPGVYLRVKWLEHDTRNFFYLVLSLRMCKVMFPLPNFFIT